MKKKIYFKNCLAFAMFSILLSACSGPKHHVTGLCKSCKPYSINGRKYKPQQYYDYNEKGLASWYGHDFHGKKSAHGGIYNMHAMTAAHKTLPLPSVVEVRNLDNGKTIKVVIDDRGPFVKGRIIDLSLAAAKELGSLDKGIARVQVKTLIPESKALSTYLKKHGKSGLDRKGRPWVQVYDEEIKGKVKKTPYITSPDITSPESFATKPTYKIQQTVYKNDDDSGDIFTPKHHKTQILKTSQITKQKKTSKKNTPSLNDLFTNSPYPKALKKKGKIVKLKNKSVYKPAWNGINSK